MRAFFLSRFRACIDCMCRSFSVLSCMHAYVVISFLLILRCVCTRAPFSILSYTSCWHASARRLMMRPRSAAVSSRCARAATKSRSGHATRTSSPPLSAWGMFFVCRMHSHMHAHITRMHHIRSCTFISLRKGGGKIALWTRHLEPATVRVGNVFLSVVCTRTPHAHALAYTLMHIHLAAQVRRSGHTPQHKYSLHIHVRI